jgi:DNA polymerase sigma
MSNHELEEKERFRQALQKTAQGVIKDFVRATVSITIDTSGILLSCYGSLANGFAVKASDMDLLLVFPNDLVNTLDPHMPGIQRALEKAFLELQLGARLLTKTRVPILKICQKPTPELYEALREERDKWDRSTVKAAKAKQDGTQESKVKDAKREKEEAKPEFIDHMVSKTDGQASGNNVALDGTVKNEVDDDSSDTHDKLNTPHPGTEQLVEPTVNPKPPSAGLGPGNTEIKYKPQTVEAVEHTDVLNVPDDGKASLNSEFQPEHKPGRSEDKSAAHNDPTNKHQGPRSTANLEFPRTGIGIQCDVNFSNHIALRNSTLLRCYCQCDDRVRPMGLFIKAWTKARKINSPYHGTLSSYGYILMMLHYLINIADPPVLPNLQHSYKEPPPHLAAQEDAFIEGFDSRFWDNEEEISEFRRRGRITRNGFSLGSLLRGFFEYYASLPPRRGPQFNWVNDVLSLRTPGGLLTKQSKGWTGALTTESGIRQRYLVAIEDPFEHDHNVGRPVVHNGIVAIRDEFRRVMTILNRIENVPGCGWIYRKDDGSIGESLLAEAEDRLDLQNPRFKEPTAINSNAPKAEGPGTNTTAANSKADGQEATANSTANSTDTKATEGDNAKASEKIIPKYGASSSPSLEKPERGPSVPTDNVAPRKGIRRGQRQEGNANTGTRMQKQRTNKYKVKQEPTLPSATDSSSVPVDPEKAKHSERVKAEGPKLKSAKGKEPAVREGEEKTDAYLPQDIGNKMSAKSERMAESGPGNPEPEERKHSELPQKKEEDSTPQKELSRAEKKKLKAKEKYKAWQTRKAEQREAQRAPRGNGTTGDNTTIPVAPLTVPLANPPPAPIAIHTSPATTTTKPASPLKHKYNKTSKTGTKPGTNKPSSTSKPQRTPNPQTDAKPHKNKSISSLKPQPISSAQVGPKPPVNIASAPLKQQSSPSTQIGTKDSRAKSTATANTTLIPNASSEPPKPLSKTRKYKPRNKQRKELAKLDLQKSTPAPVPAPLPSTPKKPEISPTTAASTSLRPTSTPESHKTTITNPSPPTSSPPRKSRLTMKLVPNTLPPDNCRDEYNPAHGPPKWPEQNEGDKSNSAYSDPVEYVRQAVAERALQGLGEVAGYDTDVEKEDEDEDEDSDEESGKSESGKSESGSEDEEEDRDIEGSGDDGSDC